MHFANFGSLVLSLEEVKLETSKLVQKFNIGSTSQWMTNHPKGGVVRIMSPSVVLGPHLLLCRVEQRAPPVFSRAAIMIRIGPHI